MAMLPLLPRVFRGGVMGETIASETLHRDSKSAVGGGSGDTTVKTVTFTPSQISTAKYNVIAFSISANVTGASDTNVKIKVNSVTLKQYTTDSTDRIYSTVYFIVDRSVDHKIDIVCGSGASENSTVSNFIVESRVAIFQ